MLRNQLVNIHTLNKLQKKKNKPKIKMKKNMI